MTLNEKVLSLIFEVVDELNENLPEEQRLKKSEDAVLFGKLDSLGMVNLIVAIEQKIEDEFGVAITIANEEAISMKDSPFKTIGTLADYASKLLDENKNE